MTGNEGSGGNLVRGSIIIFIGNILGTGAGFLTRIVSARHLGADQYGLIVLGITFLNLTALIVLLGLPDGLAAKVPQSDSPREYLIDSIRSSLVVTVLVTVATLLLSRQIANVIQEPDFTQILQIFAITLPILVIARLAVGFFRGLKMARYRVYVDNFSIQGGTLLYVGLGSVFGFGTFLLSIGWLLGALIGAIVSVGLLLREIEVGRYFSSDRILAKNSTNILKFSAPLMVSGALLKAMQQVDNYLIGFFLTSGDVGAYDAAFTMSRILMVVFGTAGFLFLPTYSELERRTERSELYKAVTKWTTLASIPIYLTFVFYPDTVLSIVYGSEYVDASSVLAIATTGFFVHVLLGQNVNALISAGDTSEIVKANGIGLIINLIANVLLIPIAGVLGAAIASAVAYTAVNVYLNVKLVQGYGVQPFTKRYLGSLALLPFVYYILFTTIPSSSSALLDLVATVAIFCLIYVPVLWFLGANDEERDTIVRRLGRVSELINSR